MTLSSAHTELIFQKYVRPARLQCRPLRGELVLVGKLGSIVDEADLAVLADLHAERC
jgi:hypothetical protein